MIVKTKGIVLHSVKYSDTSLIVKIFTESFGIQSYIIRGVRSKKAKIKPALLQNLSIVELEAYKNDKRDIQNIKELRQAYSFSSLPFDIKKSAVAVFCNEILYKSIKEEETDKNLFDFILQSIKFLDLTQNSIANFHLLFLIKLSKFLGFYPKNNFSNTFDTFDLQEGSFIKVSVPQNVHIVMPVSKYLDTLIKSSFENINTLIFPKDIKDQLLNGLLKYYSLHIPGFGNVKSHLVMKEVLM